MGKHKGNAKKMSVSHRHTGKHMGNKKHIPTAGGFRDKTSYPVDVPSRYYSYNDETQGNTAVMIVGAIVIGLFVYGYVSSR